jgi:catechol-2,3-dioxygenase
MTAMARLSAVSLDSGDPAGLAAFYREFLGLETMWSSDDFVALKGAGILLTFQKVHDFRPTDWPADTVPIPDL